MKRRLSSSSLAWLVVCVACTWSSLVHAERVPDPNKARIRILKDRVTGISANLNLAAQYQGLGLIVRGQLGYKWRLYGHSSKILENNFIQFHGLAQASPAYGNFGAGVVLQPLSIFTLSADYMYRVHFPAFTSGTLFKDRQAITDRYKSFSGFLEGETRLDEQLEAVRKANNGQRPFISGHLISASATFQIKLKGIVFAASGTLMWMFLNFEDKENSGFLYEPFSDLIVAKTDTQFSLSIIAGYEFRNLLFLVIYNHAFMFVSESQRGLVGPGIKWEMAKQAGPLKKPYLLGLVRWYVAHRWRISPLPNIALVVGTSF